MDLGLTALVGGSDDYDDDDEAVRLGTVTKMRNSRGGDEEGADEEQYLCGVCRSEQRKYCCPRCGVLSCSLQCCVAHKRASVCSGRRDVSHFISLQAMGTQELRRDSAFLWGAERATGTAKRSRLFLVPWLGVARSKCDPRPVLRRTAERRRIRFLQMPLGMKRQRDNATQVGQDGRLFWHVDIDIDGAIFSGANVDEARPLRDAVHDILEHSSEKTKSARLKSRRTNGHNDQSTTSGFENEDDATVSSKHKIYLLPKIPAPANKRIYDRLDPDVGLDISLSGKCIIEYPTIVLATETDLANGAIQLAPSALQLLSPTHEINTGSSICSDSNLS